MSDEHHQPGKASALEQWLKLKQQQRKVKATAPQQAPPLSFGQQRLWLLDQLHPGKTFYHYAHQYRFRGPLEADVLIESLEWMVERHEVLRTVFVKEEERVVQKVHQKLKPEVVRIDLRNLSATQRKSETQQAIERAGQTLFDLKNGPLLRLTIIQLEEEDHLIVLCLHHIIGDRWSLELLQTEWAYAYRTRLENQQPTLPPLKVQYGEYARTQQNRRVDSEHLDYWKSQLSGDPSPLPLPYDFQRPVQPSFEGQTLHRIFAPALGAQVRSFCQAQDVTPYVTLLAVCQLLLFRYSGQRDVLVGTPISNRYRSELESLIGFFNETVVLCSNVDPEWSFVDFVQKVKQTSLEAMSHSQVPFDQLVRALQPERSGNIHPFFQVMFLYNNAVKQPDFGAAVALEEEGLDLGGSKFDLTFFAQEQANGGLGLSVEYTSDLFRPSTIERMMAHFEVLLESILADPHRPLHQYELLTQEERNQLLHAWSTTAFDYPTPSQPIHRLIEEQALKHPNRLAVIDEEQELTYDELNRQANAVAHRLVAEGVKAGRPIGLYTHRSVKMMIGLLGILKAGGAYLPLDPEYPAERIHFMLQDTELSVLLTQEQLIDQLPDAEVKIVVLETVSAPSAIEDTAPALVDHSIDDSAYLIYTSGSTGKPKGVPVSHRNLLYSTSARFAFYPKQPGCFLLLSSFAFDSSVAGIFWSLCSGGSLLLPRRRIEQEITALVTLIRDHQVTHSLLLPSLYGVLLEYAQPAALASLDSIMVAGEACSASLVRKHFEALPEVKLYNEYGPTEASVWCIAHQMTREDGEGMVPIGKAIPGAEVYILDAWQQPVPIGVSGELYIGGPGVTGGYLERPTATAAKFVPHPFQSEGKLYRTGDLGRFRLDGRIEFLGRIDHQIKIRGFRVEPDEIREILSREEGVREAVVLAREEVQGSRGGYRLLAYITGEYHLNIPRLKDALRSKLPDYMVPTYIEQLADFPRLPNGKIKLVELRKRALPKQQSGEDYQEARTALEKSLVTIWEAVLTHRPIGTTDHFFEIGGDSILSIEVIAKARQEGIEILPTQLFNLPTIGALARKLERGDDQEENGSRSLVPLETQGTKMPLFCIHSGGAHVHFYRAFARYLEADRPVYAIQPVGLDGDRPFLESIEAMAAHYIQDIKEVQLEGPYALLGTCFSNAVALEMARQLEASGEQLEILAIVDSGPAHLVGSPDGKARPLRRFAELLTKGDWYRIRKKIKSRLDRWRGKPQQQMAWQQDPVLSQMIQSLNDLYGRYHWRPYAGQIQFFRSSEFHQRADKQFHLKQWSALAKGGVEVHVVPGHHISLFEEPEVEGLAREVRACLLAQ